MTCPHAETTAILALFDEAPPDFAAHLSGCAECQEVVGVHRETIDLITPHLAAAPQPPRRPLWPVALLSTLAAAAAAILLVISAPTAETEPIPDASVAADDEMLQLDEDLLSLELELALMTLEDN